MTRDRSDLTSWFDSQLDDLKNEFDRLGGGAGARRAPGPDERPSSPPPATSRAPEIAPPPEVAPARVAPVSTPGARSAPAPAPCAVRLVTCGQPLARSLLRVRDLVGIHFCRQLSTVVLGWFRAHQRGKVEPLVCLNEVDRATLAC